LPGRSQKERLVAILEERIIMPPEQRPWYENALLLAVAGSIIVVVGQLAGTVIPLMWGPEDISDFSMNLDRTFSLVKVHNNSLPEPDDAGPVSITIEDLHPILRPYKFNVNVQALGNSSDIYIRCSNPETRAITQEAKAGDTLYVGIFTNITKTGYYPITFQGTGSGGRMRNATFYLWVVNDEDYQRSLNGTLHLPLIQTT
jgi:hypothetical protein